MQPLWLCLTQTPERLFAIAKSFCRSRRASWACAKVQENVKQTIQNMTGITVSRVDVIVAGLEEPAADQHK